MGKRKHKKKQAKNLIIGAGALAGATMAAVMLNSKNQTKKKKNEQTDEKEKEKQGKQENKQERGCKSTDRQVYFIGGGLASLAGAAYLIRDCHMEGKRIHILEGMSVLGGSNDGAGDVNNGFVCRGGRMLNEETYENFWELFKDIPSLDMPNKSVTEEILNFDHLHPTYAQAR